ncbi:hypothetical protein EST38_g9394 [Candolleomyces aberdarensis]|uniref:Uncharacterized protein n=1 Tax=Candolleomyces aberdarensis TaxID=2316362 RepID=A0A4Q2DA43_9AGAR|nr:hypothetical protein EST38_g9394 [Candolleomyces aberdarensis]
MSTLCDSTSPVYQYPWSSESIPAFIHTPPLLLSAISGSKEAMGGSAFHTLLGKQAFPRVPPGLYSTLKARLLPKVCELYSFVAVPVEAPEKTDYGDLDFLVAGPKPTETGVERSAIPHGMVQAALGAKHVIPVDGNRTSNYALPISVDECKVFSNLVQDDSFSTSNLEVFFQVDVHVCQDAAEWERIRFFHSYGDMGMMLGLITRSFGLRIGEHGLKVRISLMGHFNSPELSN